MWLALNIPVVSEYRAGTDAYNDHSHVEGTIRVWDYFEQTVLATVISIQYSNRAEIDAGSIVLTSETLGIDGYGHIVCKPDIAINSLSDEHGPLVGQESIGLRVGKRVRIIPNYACVTSNMVDEIIETRGQEIPGAHRVTARSMTW